jgi:hypothetical protein
MIFIYSKRLCIIELSPNERKRKKLCSISSCVHHVCIHVHVHARRLTISQGAGTKKRRLRLSDGYKRHVNEPPGVCVCVCVYVCVCVLHEFYTCKLCMHAGIPAAGLQPATPARATTYRCSFSSSNHQLTNSYSHVS